MRLALVLVVFIAPRPSLCAHSTLECFITSRVLFTPIIPECFTQPSTLEPFDLHRRERDRMIVRIVGR
mgnify:CR=1 FL=1